MTITNAAMNVASFLAGLWCMSAWGMAMLLDPTDARGAASLPRRHEYGPRLSPFPRSAAINGARSRVFASAVCTVDSRPSNARTAEVNVRVRGIESRRDQATAVRNMLCHHGFQAVSAFGADLRSSMMGGSGPGVS